MGPSLASSSRHQSAAPSLLMISVESDRHTPTTSGTSFPQWVELGNTDSERAEAYAGNTGLDLFRMDPCCCAPAGLPPDIRDQLRKGFRDLHERHEAWKRTLAACTPLLASLANLAEQGQSLRAVALEKVTPLHPFPDLPKRLRCKQHAASEALLEQLHQETLQELREVRDAISARVSGVSLLCGQLGEGPGWAKAAFQRSASCPSAADMLEWLLDIEGFYHRTFLEAKFLLLQVRGEDLAGMQALPEAWARVLQHSQQSLVEDVLLKVSFFLEEAT